MPACRFSRGKVLGKALDMKTVLNFVIKWFFRVIGLAGVIVGVSYYVAPSTRDAFHHPIENLLWGVFFLMASSAPAIGTLGKKKKD